MQNEGTDGENAVPSPSSAMAELWRRIRDAGPLPDTGTFDPLTVGDVLQAERSQMQYERRKAFIAAFSWAIPTQEAVSAIARALENRRLLEVGAGGGLWAFLLSAEGIEVTATDAEPPPHLHFDVERIDGLSAMSKYAQHEALMLCWPPFKDRLALDALAGFAGDRLVVVGDSRFTAEVLFHASLESGWPLESSVELPSWPGTRDAVRVLGRATHK